MRCYQEVGLKTEALIWLNENVELIDDENMKCPHCGIAISKKRHAISTNHVDMFYGDGPELFTYKTKDGRIISEIVQTSPWSSGPMAFLCLQDDNTGEKMFEWTENEIMENI